ncbi:Ig-like domain-containing protein, partial [Aureicoccus marinus]
MVGKIILYLLSQILQMNLKRILFSICFCLITSSLYSQASISGELKKWHKVTLSWSGPTVSESDPSSPFLNYRLNVELISPSGVTWTVPGFFAADGNAGESSASSGNVWRVHFAPEELGVWTYTVSFRMGTNIAISEDPIAGNATSFDGDTGSFSITQTDKILPDNRANGRLDYVGIRYLQFQETGTYFLKAGADSPENFLSYDEFDNTNADYSWAAHFGDWNNGDPTWKTEKGKDLIGAINYLHSRGMNVFSFITFNVNGDGDDVWPYSATTIAQMDDMSASDIDNRTRFDVSKLDQWEVVFNHADKLGMYLHFKLQETENDQLLDGGDLDLERRLYYREMIARFGHHLALNWNIGEENSQTPAQRIETAQFFYDLDPYRHNTVVHTRTNDKNTIYTPLLGNNSLFTGISMQNDPIPNHEDVKEWIIKSEDAGRPWVVANDEQGSAQVGVATDEGYSGNQGTAEDNREEIRNQVLWGTLMAGGAGVEYYFGSRTGVEDLEGDDYRSRETKWDDAKIALDFFTNYLPFWEMNTSDNLVSSGEMCFSKTDEIYVVYLPTGGTPQLDLTDTTTDFSVKWYNPRSGGNLLDSDITEVSGGTSLSLGNPPSDPNLDWVVLLQSVSNNVNVTGVLLTPETAEVDEDTDLQLTASVQPADATNQQLSWSSDNTAVATVDSNGLVSAISPGVATITVTTTDGAFTDTAAITVVRPVTSV